MIKIVVVCVIFILADIEKFKQYTVAYILDKTVPTSNETSPFGPPFHFSQEGIPKLVERWRMDADKFAWDIVDVLSVVSNTSLSIYIYII